MKWKFKLNVWQIVPIGSILILQIWRQIAGNTWKVMLWPDLNLIIGWVIGWLLAEADHLVYAVMCNPQELTCQRVRAEMDKKNWRNAWKMLEDSKFERNKLPIRNVLTLISMTGVGIWVVSSSGSLLASGLVFGFCVRLFSELIFDTDYKKWYWIFAREFSLPEHKGFLGAIASGIILQWWYLIRG